MSHEILPFSGRRQNEIELRSLTGQTDHADLSAVRGHDFPGDGQTEAGSTGIRARHPKEALEKPRLKLAPECQVRDR